MTPSLHKTKNTTPGIILVGLRQRAIKAARRCGWEPLVLDVKARQEQIPVAYGGTISWALEKAIAAFPDEPPVAVVAVTTGSARAAAAIREHFGLPGISPQSALFCHDKLSMKQAITAAGLPCAPWLETTGKHSPETLRRALGLPLFLKIPVSSGGRGVRLCRSETDIAKYLRPGMLAESFVPGTEMSVETFRSGGRDLFQNHTAYLIPRIANVIPAKLSPETISEVKHFSNLVHQALGLVSGLTHLEIFLTENGPVFGEIAARPPGGYLMELMHCAYGIDPWESLLRISVGETPPFPSRAKQHAGVWLLHPGEGLVQSITGLFEARSLPFITDLSCKLRPGEQVDERFGSGESVGRIFAEAPNFDQCAAALKHAAETLKITLT